MSKTVVADGGFIVSGNAGKKVVVLDSGKAEYAAGQVWAGAIMRWPKRVNAHGVAIPLSPLSLDGHAGAFDRR